MVSRGGVAAVLVVVVCCLGLAAGPASGSAHAAAPVASDLLGGGAPGPIPPLPLPGNPPLPENDPFYRAPSDLERHKPGTVLRSRQITALGPTGLASRATYQLLFRSTDAAEHPIAAVTTLLLPIVPGPGERKLVSYHEAEDSLTTGCSPSYTLRTNSGLTQPADNTLVSAALSNGWDVVVPDHEGPRSEMGVGSLAGRITLDSIRAAESFAPAGLDGSRTPVGLTGYSGGSIPTLWANALARDYAPELNIVGTTAGGTLADIGAVMRVHGGPPVFSLVVLIAIGLDRAYPDFNLDSLLNDRGRALADRLGRDANGCVSSLSAAPLDTVGSDTHYPDMGSLLDVSRVANVLDKVDLVTGPRLASPALIVQGLQDELVPVGQVDDLVAANCGHGAAIDYVRVPGEHFTTTVPWETQSIVYLRERFAGRVAPDDCS